jgi:hypothetical protein
MQFGALLVLVRLARERVTSPTKKGEGAVGNPRWHKWWRNGVRRSEELIPKVLIGTYHKD